LIIVARQPVPGQVKTRLGRTIGMERAAQLYTAFLEDIATHFAPSTVGTRFRVAWSHTPESVSFPDALSHLAPKPFPRDMLFLSQQGSDWGARQVNLLRRACRRGYDKIVLMASDSPHVCVATVDEAFASLDLADLVLGRVRDGGYYLIGVRGFHDPISGVPMSVGAVADGIIMNARRLGLRSAEIAPTFDIDVEADLNLLIDELRPAGHLAPATWAALKRLGLRA
jgi:glycosyltransferase A (GT-A) superfamily protein (DUF2064 family)